MSNSAIFNTVSVLDYTPALLDVILNETTVSIEFYCNFVYNDLLTSTSSSGELT